MRQLSIQAKLYKKVTIIGQNTVLIPVSWLTQNSKLYNAQTKIKEFKQENQKFNLYERKKKKHEKLR